MQQAKQVSEVTKHADDEAWEFSDSDREDQSPPPEEELRPDRKMQDSRAYEPRKDASGAYSGQRRGDDYSGGGGGKWGSSGGGGDRRRGGRDRDYDTRGGGSGFGGGYRDDFGAKGRPRDRERFDNRGDYGSKGFGSGWGGASSSSGGNYTSKWGASSGGGSKRYRENDYVPPELNAEVDEASKHAWESSLILPQERN